MSGNLNDAFEAFGKGLFAAGMLVKAAMISAIGHQRLLQKRTRMLAVLEAFHGEGLSTTVIAENLGIEERVVCDLLEEARL